MIRPTLTSFVIVIGVAALVLGGCVTERIDSPRSRLYGTNQLENGGNAGEKGDASASSLVDPEAKPASSQSRLLTEVIQLGEIRYDMMTFPLVSPGGRYMVSETGIHPTLATITASLDSTVPVATTITVYELVPADPESENPDASKPHIIERYTLDESLVLGRSCNANGFLVEAPQPNNTRWLGFVSWETGEITWIAQDEYVNAHGALGPDGRLAWSRREPRAENFELRVMIDGRVSTFGEDDASWMYPTWTRSGDGLFCVRLLPDDRMTAIFMRGEDRASMLQSLREIILSKQGSLNLAYSMMAPNPAVMGLPLRNQPMLVFYHPEFNGVAIWRPFEQGKDATMLMDQGSAAGVLDANDYLVLTTPGGLVGQPLDNPDARQRIAREMLLPRLTDSKLWKYVLFANDPSSPETLRVLGMNLRIAK